MKNILLNGLNEAKSTLWIFGLLKQAATLDIASPDTCQCLKPPFEPFTPSWIHSCYNQPRVGTLKLGWKLIVQWCGYMLMGHFDFAWCAIWNGFPRLDHLEWFPKIGSQMFCNHHNMPLCWGHISDFSIFFLQNGWTTPADLKISMRVKLVGILNVLVYFIMSSKQNQVS